MNRDIKEIKDEIRDLIPHIEKNFLSKELKFLDLMLKWRIAIKVISIF